MGSTIKRYGFTNKRIVCVWLLKGSYQKEYINLITCKHEKNRPERIVLAASEHTQPQKYTLRNKQLES